MLLINNQWIIQNNYKKKIKTNILFFNYQSKVMKVIHNKIIDIINK